MGDVNQMISETYEYNVVDVDFTCDDNLVNSNYYSQSLNSSLAPFSRTKYAKTNSKSNPKAKTNWSFGVSANSPKQPPSQPDSVTINGEDDDQRHGLSTQNETTFNNSNITIVDNSHELEQTINNVDFNRSSIQSNDSNTKTGQSANLLNESNSINKRQMYGDKFLTDKLDTERLGQYKTCHLDNVRSDVNTSGCGVETLPENSVFDAEVDHYLANTTILNISSDITLLNVSNVQNSNHDNHQITSLNNANCSLTNGINNSITIDVTTGYDNKTDILHSANTTTTTVNEEPKKKGKYIKNRYQNIPLVP